MIRKKRKKRTAAGRAPAAKRLLRRTVQRAVAISTPYGTVRLPRGWPWDWACLGIWLRKPVIITIAKGRAQPDQLHLHRGDRVVWYNSDPVCHSAHFDSSAWPFCQPYVEIPVDAGQFSRVFTIPSRVQTAFLFIYQIWGGGAPPGGPEIVVEP